MTDDTLRQLLEQATTIAVVGASDAPHRAAHGVMKYMLGRGYDCLPVNPHHDTVLGLRCFPTLAAMEQQVDIINVFRRLDALAPLTTEILALPWKPALVFFQEGLSHESSAARLQEAGIAVVQDRCLYKEHWRLIGLRNPLPDQR